MLITSQYIKKLPYTDFVGLINQWNVLPGALSTISKWVKYSNINNQSRVLEVACSTGFSSREIALMTRCNGIGFDLSHQAVKMANYNKKKYTPKINFKYLQIDGYKFKVNQLFSHIVVGASLKFFPNPQKMFDRCINMLKDEGYLLASPFFIKKAIPKSLIKKAESVFNITPTTSSYKKIMSMYNKMEIIFEERNDIYQETEEEINYYCKCTTNRACDFLKVKDKEIHDIMYKRLYDIKKMTNKLRPYQNYVVLVLRYRKAIYPNRFVELF